MRYCLQLELEFVGLLEQENQHLLKSLDCTLLKN